jgi:hypothetical protein
MLKEQKLSTKEDGMWKPTQRKQCKTWKTMGKIL